MPVAQATLAVDIREEAIRPVAGVVTEAATAIDKNRKARGLSTRGLF